MTEQTQLRANSVLLWLVVLISIGIIFIGGRFILDPIQGAQGFGVPAGETYTYLWAKGTRDIVSGLLLIAFLWLRVSRQVLATFLFVAALIPIGDMINVYVNAGDVPALLIHGGTAVFMCVLGILLLRGK